MPVNTLAPLGIPNDVVVKIHPPVETKDRKDEDVLKEVSSESRVEKLEI